MWQKPLLKNDKWYYNFQLIQSIIIIYCIIRSSNLYIKIHQNNVGSYSKYNELDFYIILYIVQRDNKHLEKLTRDVKIGCINFKSRCNWFWIVISQRPVLLKTKKKNKWNYWTYFLFIFVLVDVDLHNITLQI